MYDLKTRPTDTDVEQLIRKIGHDQKQLDARRLLDIFSETTGRKPVVWGDKLIGFGSYRYRYKSGHGGEMFITGFAVTKTRITLHLYMEEPELKAFLDRLGKATAGKSCVYVNKLSDIDLSVLPEMIRQAERFILKTFLQEQQ